MPHDPTTWIATELAELDAQGLRRTLCERQLGQGAVIRVDGHELVNFGSNDYLGLASHQCHAAVCTAIDSVGWGAGASPLVVGRGSEHAALERELADFEGTEAALLFSSGYAANVGAIAALAGRSDAVFSDAKNHASIIDGCRLSGATIHVYGHGDIDHLRTLLIAASSARRRLIVTDGLFSMDGDAAPLVELAELAEEFDAMLMVDEAHATGVFGQHGRGISEALGVGDRVHVHVGTLSKALGSIGGFVAGRQVLIDWLANLARSYVFSTASPEAIAASGRAALKLVRQEPHRRTGLLSRAAKVRQQLKTLGWQTGNSTSQIIPLHIGDPDKTLQAAARLRERGLFVPGIRPPSVPQGESLLRISLSYAHDQEMIDRLLRELATLTTWCSTWCST
jgi:8-amino-7-oxononanoate synthase